jgi:hypothetical protein
MKPIAFLTTVLLALPSFAQDKPAPGPEAAKPEAAKPETTKEAAKPSPTKSAASKKGATRRWNEDARHCLEKASNTEVIKCAEEFL